MTYPVPSQILETTFEVKKSLFHARAGLAENREQAMTLLAECKSTYPDARHHCWAYLLGNPFSPHSAAMSDDGEPSGTAGKPILNVLQHKGVGDVMVVVSRYFGGIKLGAGGLVRAYSASAQQTMEQLPVVEHVLLTPVQICTEFRHEQFFRHFVEQHAGQVEHCEYQQGVTLYLALPEQHVQALQESAANLQATVKLTKTNAV